MTRLILIRFHGPEPVIRLQWSDGILLIFFLKAWGRETWTRSQRSPGETEDNRWGWSRTCQEGTVRTPSSECCSGVNRASQSWSPVTSRGSSHWRGSCSSAGKVKGRGGKDWGCKHFTMILVVSHIKVVFLVEANFPCRKPVSSCCYQDCSTSREVH